MSDPAVAVPVDVMPPCRRGRMRATEPAAGGAEGCTDRLAPPPGLDAAFARLPTET